MKARNRIKTGIAWHDTIPEEWRIMRVKDGHRIVGGGTPSATEIGVGREVMWATPSDFSTAQRKLEATSRSISAAGHKEIGRAIVGRNGVLVSCRAPAGKVALPTSPMAFNQGCKGLSPRGANIHRPWFFYALVAQRAQIEEAAKGATFTEISGEALKRVSFPKPPYEEQVRIASWLDLQVGRVESRLALNERKRELLTELRKTTIHHATLRGLDPNVELRDTKVSWIGLAPSHWSIVRIADLFHEVTDPGSEGLPMLSVSIHSGISDRELDDDEMDRKVNRSADKSKYKRIRTGDLVYNMMRAWQGAFGTAKIDGLVSPAYVVARPKAKVCAAYVEHLLRGPAGIEEMRRRSRGITDFRLRLYWDEFKNIRIALPPEHEQAMIAKFVDGKVAQINKQIKQLGRLDELLEEQRDSMIHAAINGEVDLSSYERVSAKPLAA